MGSPTSDLHRNFGGSIPKYYDELLGAGWMDKFAADLARRIPSDPGGDVLEIAAGTGLVTRPLRKRLDARRRLVATDLSDAMLDYAREKMGDLAGITWQTADATKLPFADGEFAAAACSFGVMYVPDRKAFFSEARRVLKRAGLLFFNVWDRIEHHPCARIYAELVEAMFPGDAEMRYRLPFEMHDEGLLRGLLDEAGFTTPRLEKVRVPVEGLTARDIATGMVRGTPRGQLLANRGLDPDVVIEKTAAALEEVGGKGRDFRLHCQAIVVQAAAR